MKGSLQSKAGTLHRDLHRSPRVGAQAHADRLIVAAEVLLEVLQAPVQAQSDPPMRCFEGLEGAVAGEGRTRYAELAHEVEDWLGRHRRRVYATRCGDVEGTTA